MSESWASQDRKDLRRTQTDLEECRVKIKELRAAKNRALEALKASNIAMKRGRMPGPWTMLIAELEEVK